MDTLTALFVGLWNFVAALPGILRTGAAIIGDNPALGGAVLLAAVSGGLVYLGTRKGKS